MKKQVLLLLAIFCSAAFVAQAQELKVGFIDPQEVLVKMPDYAAVERKLQNFAERKRDEFNTLNRTFDQRVEAYEQKMAVLSNDARVKEETELEEIREKIMTFQETYQMELFEEQRTQLSPLFEQIEKAIAAVANEMGITFVLNPRTSNGDLILLYVSEEANNTLNLARPVMTKLGI